MMDQDPNQSISCPPRVLVAEWLIAAQRAITPVMIHNARKKSGFSWFPNQNTAAVTSNSIITITGLYSVSFVCTIDVVVLVHL